MTEPVPKNPEKKLWKKSTVRAVFTAFVLISMASAWIGIPLTIILLIDFIIFFGIATYGRITGKIETRELSYEEKYAGLTGYTLSGHRDLYRD